MQHTAVLGSASSLLLTTLASALLALCACEFREEVPLDLSPPNGAVSGVVSVRHGLKFDVFAFNVGTASSLPVVHDIDHVAPLQLAARFYDRSLAELQLEPGQIPARINEADFGSVPYSEAFPEDHTIEIHGGVVPAGWTLGKPADELSRFVSPRLPPDPDACFDLEVLKVFQPGTVDRPTRVARMGPDRALVTFDRGRREKVFDVREVDGTWLIEPLAEEHPVRRIVTETGTLVMLAGDDRGGYLAGTCTWAQETKTSTIWWAPNFGAELEPIYVDPPGPECPVRIVRVGEDEFLVKRFGGTLYWLHPEGGALVRTELTACPTCQELFVHGPDVLGLGSAPDNRLYVYRDRQRLRVEVPSIPGDDAFAGLGYLRDDLVLVVRKESLNAGNEFHRRGADGQWTQFQATSAALASNVSSLNDTLLFAASHGQIFQLSERHGFCEITPGLTTELEGHTDLLKLDGRTFLLAGFPDTDNRTGPSKVTIVRARPRDPSAATR